MRAFSRPICASASSRDPGISFASTRISSIASSPGYQAATLMCSSR